MEILVEVLLWLVQFFAELLLQVAFEAFVELGLHAVREPFRLPKPNPWVASLGYFLLGTAVGFLSVWLFPTPFLVSRFGRIANVIATPLVAGGVMATFGAWRRRRGEELLRIDRFAYGFLFAFAMALVRFLYAHG